MSAPASSSSSPSGGLGFAGALFLVLLVLKLTGRITWSWWWVTAPLWGVVVVVFALLFSLIAIAVVASKERS